MENFRSRIKRKIPNGLTILRIGLAAVFPFSNQILYLPIIAVALVTEFLDGWLARRWQVVSRSGILLDPVADKLFIMSVILTALAKDKLTFWELIAICSRDITVWIGCAWAALLKQWDRITKMRPSIMGKLATTCQFVFLISLFAQAPVRTPLLLATIIASVSASLHYIWSFRRDVAHPRACRPT